ncbi:hypothetical protein GBA52_019652 [Prunus armeniaca]|nr:hypothetical protein GBA52_019652 [Prunus armeniaca]
MTGKIIQEGSWKLYPIRAAIREKSKLFLFSCSWRWIQPQANKADAAAKDVKRRSSKSSKATIGHWTPPLSRLLRRLLTSTHFHSESDIPLLWYIWLIANEGEGGHRY